MPMRPLSFDPPPISIDQDVAWVLRAAFAKLDAPTPPNDSRRALEIARATELSGRVAARLGMSRHVSMSALSSEWSADYYANVAQEALLMHAQEQIAGLATRLRIPAIAVKFGGLRLAGVLSRGARTAADLDLLLPEANAREFWRALLAAGFQRTNTHEYPHQLEALRGPFGAVIDVHVHLPGVIVENGTFASADQLIVHGLASSSGGGMLVPSSEVLAAHAIVHGLVQNRSTPQTYSPLRMLSDVMDLRRVEPDVVHRASSYLAPELRAACETLERLCVSLADGAFLEPGFAGTSEHELLQHCVAARLDFDYAERLRAAGFVNKLADGSSAREIARYVGDLLYPSESALETLYGPALGHLGRARRRVLRPFDLVIRAARRTLRSWRQ